MTRAEGEIVLAKIRPYRPEDLEDLYRICLLTGDSGADATDHYEDPRIIGDLYAAPYGVLSPECALVIEDEEGVAGYIVGTPDTAAFEARLEAEWWPHLREIYPDPAKVPRAERTWDQHRARQIHRPIGTPSEVVKPFPAHLHIDMVPRVQGRGFGKRLIDRWLGIVHGMGARGVHLGVGEGNKRAVRFYNAYGFQRLELPQYPGALWFTTTDLAGREERG
jgi:ribosomal protein S18 acetylase RimI-like enzyme